MKRFYSFISLVTLLILAMDGCTAQEKSDQVKSNTNNINTENNDADSSLNHPADDQNYPETQLSEDQFALKGTVLDESGNPASGVEVRLLAYVEALKTKTDRNGRFSFPVYYYSYPEAYLFASQMNNNVSVIHQYKLTKDLPKTTGPVELRLKPNKKTSAHIVDAERNNLGNVTVKAFLSTDTIFTGKTNSNGFLEIQYPQASKIFNVIAFKPGIGFDYFNNFKWKSDQVSPTIKPTLPEKLNFTLDGANTLRILALDLKGEPVPNETFIIREILKNKEGGNIDSTYLNQNDRDLWATTNEKGVAEISWFPSNFENAKVELYSSNYSMEEEYRIKNHDMITAKLSKLRMVKFKVTFPDGSPAPSIGIIISNNSNHSYIETNSEGKCNSLLTTMKQYKARVNSVSWSAPSHEFYLDLDGGKEIFKFELHPN